LLWQINGDALKAVYLEVEKRAAKALASRLQLSVAASRCPVL
jgi:hypothetical protein